MARGSYEEPRSPARELVVEQAMRAGSSADVSLPGGAQQAVMQYAEKSRFVFIDNVPAKLLPTGMFHPVNQFGPGVKLVDADGLVEPVDDRGFVALIPGNKYTTSGGKSIKLRRNGSDAGARVIIATFRALQSAACDDAGITDSSRLRLCDSDGDEITSLVGLDHNQVVYWCLEDEPFIVPRVGQTSGGANTAGTERGPEAEGSFFKEQGDATSPGSQLTKASPRSRAASKKPDLPDSPMALVPLVDVMKSSGLCYPRIAPNVPAPDLMRLRDVATGADTPAEFMKAAADVLECMRSPAAPKPYRLADYKTPDGPQAVIMQRLLELLFQVDREPGNRSGASKGRYLNTVKHGPDHKAILRHVAAAAPFLTKNVVPIYVDFEKKTATLSDMIEDAFMARGRPLPARGLSLAERLRYTGRTVMVFADEVQLVWALRNGEQAKAILAGFELNDQNGWCEQMFVRQVDGAKKHSVILVQMV